MDRRLERSPSEHAFFIFRQYDTDSSGGLSADELIKCLTDYEFGVKFSSEEAQLAVKLLSRAGSDEISYVDFSKWWMQSNRFQLLQWSEQELDQLRIFRDEFAKFDKNGSGQISRSEFRALHNILLAQGFDLPTSLTETMTLIDVDQSNSIDFNEFCTFAKSRNLFAKKKELSVASETTPNRRQMGLGGLMHQQTTETKEPEKEIDKQTDVEIAENSGNAPKRPDPNDYVAKVLDKSGYTILKTFRKYGNSEMHCSFVCLLTFLF